MDAGRTPRRILTAHTKKYPSRRLATTRSAIHPPPNVPVAPASSVTTPRTTAAAVALICLSRASIRVAHVANAPNTKVSALYPAVESSQSRVERIFLVVCHHEAVTRASLVSESADSLG